MIDCLVSLGMGLKDIFLEVGEGWIGLAQRYAEKSMINWDVTEMGARWDVHK